MRRRRRWAGLVLVVVIAGWGCESRCKKEAQAVVRGLCTESVDALSTPASIESCVRAERARSVASSCRQPGGPAFDAWESCLDAGIADCIDAVDDVHGEGWQPCQEAAASACAEEAQPRVREWYACTVRARASWQEPAARERCRTFDREAALARCEAEAPEWVHYDEMIERCEAGGRIGREDAAWWLPGATRYP